MTARRRAAFVRTYRDLAGKWRWLLRASNGRLVASSGEWFARSRAAAVYAARRMLKAAADVHKRGDVR